MTIVDTPSGASQKGTWQADTIRLIFTYLIAMIVVVGGGLLLVMTRGEAESKDLAIIAAGFIGSALTFVFGQESSARSARQSTAATIAANSNANTVNGL